MRSIALAVVLLLSLPSPLAAAAAPKAGTSAKAGKKKAAKTPSAASAAKPTKKAASSSTPAESAPGLAPLVSQPPAVAPLVSPPAEPTVPAAPPPPGYRAVEAFGDVKAPTVESATASATVSGGEPQRFRVTPRVGVLLPRTELSVGPLAGVEAGYRLPLLNDKLRLSLGAGYSLVTFKGARSVPGRGYDPAFIQNTTLVPLELVVSYDLLDAAAGYGLSAGIGYGLYLSWSSCQALGAQSEQRDASSAVIGAVRGLLPLGPGALLVDVRYAELKADLGLLEGVAVSTLSGFSLALGYALDF